jgi:hypothetical protein
MVVYLLAGRVGYLDVGVASRRRFTSGHGFSRAETDAQGGRLQPLRAMAIPSRHRSVVGTYFVTSRTWQSRQIFKTPPACEIFVEFLFRYRDQGACRLHAFVLGIIFISSSHPGKIQHWSGPFNSSKAAPRKRFASACCLAFQYGNAVSATTASATPPTTIRIWDTSNRIPSGKRRRRPPLNFLGHQLRANNPWTNRLRG